MMYDAGVALGAFRHVGSDPVTMLLHYVLGSVVFRVIGRLPLPVMVAVGVLAFVLLMRRRRARRT